MSRFSRVLMATLAVALILLVSAGPVSAGTPLEWGASLERAKGGQPSPTPGPVPSPDPADTNGPFRSAFMACECDGDCGKDCPCDCGGSCSCDHGKGKADASPGNVRGLTAADLSALSRILGVSIVPKIEVDPPGPEAAPVAPAPSDSRYAGGYYYRRDRFGVEHYGTDWPSVWNAAENAQPSIVAAPAYRSGSSCYTMPNGQRVCPR